LHINAQPGPEKAVPRRLRSAPVERPARRQVSFAAQRGRCWFTPTFTSWISTVENLFSVITRRRIRHGVFTSVADLQHAIRGYIREHSHSPKPFLRTKPPDLILAKLTRLPVASV
jgi:hypothetical protein